MRRALATLGLAASLAGCAGPPLTLYTLGPDAPPPAQTLSAPVTIIAVARVSLPDALDTEDILVRDGATLKRSPTGRWAERLSLAVTDLITAQLAAQYPNALVTDQPQAGPVTERLSINISQLDVSTSGDVTLAADWTWSPGDPRLPLRHDRARIMRHTVTTSDDAAVQALREAVGELVKHVGRKEAVLF